MRHAVFRPLLPLLALGALVALRAPDVPYTARKQASLGAAVALGLAEHGWIADATRVQWVDRPSGGLASLWSGPRAIVLAHKTDEPADVLLVRTRLTPEGRLISIGHVCNLSDTAAVEEDQVRVTNSQVAWSVKVGDETIAIHSVDLTRADTLPNSEFGWLARLQMHLTWLQETGQFAGIQKHEYRIDPPAKRLRYSFDASGITGQADTDAFQIGANQLQTPRPRIAAVASAYGHPGNFVTWAVDRVRAMPWFGNERMQLVKTLVFNVVDHLERVRGKVTRDDGLSSLNEEVGHVLDNAGSTASDPESGFPPDNLPPILKDPLPHEGQWSELEADPFIARRAAQPPPFAFTFLRTDHERPYTENLRGAVGPTAS